MFDDGFSLPINNPGTSFDCYQAPLYERIANGSVYGYKEVADRCGHTLLIERISEYVMGVEAEGIFILPLLAK